MPGHARLAHLLSPVTKHLTFSGPEVGLARLYGGRLRLKCDGTRAETRSRLSMKRTSPFKPAGASVQSTTGRRVVHISLQGLYCSCKPVFCSHVTFTGCPLHSLFSPSLLLPCVTVCHHISTGLYWRIWVLWGMALCRSVYGVQPRCSRWVETDWQLWISEAIFNVKHTFHSRKLWNESNKTTQ